MASRFPDSPFSNTACAGRVMLISGGGSGIGVKATRAAAIATIAMMKGVWVCGRKFGRHTKSLS